MTVSTVQIRIIADSEAEAEAAIAALRDGLGSSRVAITSPRQGRKGSEWLAYGTLQIETPDAEPSAYTGKTRRLRS